VGVLSLSCTSGSWLSTWNELGGDPYALDGWDRRVSAGTGGRACPSVTREVYRGSRLRFTPAAEIAPPFAQRLQLFENAVVDLSTLRYGRAPKRVLNAGAYVCRPVEHRNGRWSEHALGNAIDITGFEFESLPKCKEVAPALQPALCRAFTVRIDRHWYPKSDTVAREHSLFLRDLASRLVKEQVFRSLISPADPAHETHLHLDMAPYHYVRM
jgi:hypothetical protein